MTERASGGRSGRRTRRGWPSGAAVAGVVLLVLISPLAENAAAHGLAGAVPTLSSYLWNTGCSSARAPNPTWSAAVGHGTFGARVASRTCSPARGGASVSSVAYTGSSITLVEPLRLPSGAGGVNVTWHITATSFTRAAVTSWTCPTSYANTSTNYGYTWYNFTDTYQDCYVLSFVQLYGYSYLIDLTGNTTLYSPFYFDLYNLSGVQNYTSTYTGNYSNASYWSYSYTLVWTPSNTSYGPSGRLIGSSAPTWFLNGTFVRAHHYELVTYVGVYAYAVIAGFRGSAAASLNAATLGNGIRTSVATW